MKDLTIHPYCKVFPDMPDADLQALAEDIRKHGQRIPMYRWGKQLVDGKNRLKACEIAGVQPHIELWAPTNPSDESGTDEELWAFVNSVNDLRRHQTASQRSLVGVARLKYAKLRNGVTIATVAEELKISERLINTAKTVDEKGSDDLIEAVRDGKVKVSDAAKIVDQPKPTQNAAVAKVTNGKARTVADAVREPGDESEHEPQDGKKRSPLQIQRSKTIKTVEALMRAFDDLHALKKSREHSSAIFSCKALLQKAKDWS